MHLRRLDDYQSWMIEVGDKKVAIDPWLRDELVLPPGPWMFRRTRTLPPGGPQAIAGADALVLSAPFGDHCDEATLEVLPRKVRVLASAGAAKRARGMGFTDVTVLADGDRGDVFEGLRLEAVAAAFPYAKDSLGYVFESHGKRAYLETHVVDLKHRARLEGLDAIIMPVQGVRLLGLGLAMSPTRAIETLRALAPKRAFVTGENPQAVTGLLSKVFLFYKGSVPSFVARAKEELGLDVTSLGPGEAVALA